MIVRWGRYSGLSVGSKHMSVALCPWKMISVEGSYEDIPRIEVELIHTASSSLESAFRYIFLCRLAPNKD